MRVIFLDVDGVLNTRQSKSRCGALIGIDSRKMKNLRRIVDETGAQIILVSSWKSALRNMDELLEDGRYLLQKFRKHGVKLSGITKDNSSDRGRGIAEWLENHDCDNWIVIDDDIFEDYEKYGILERLVKTDFYRDDGGLNEEMTDLAIRMLKEEVRQ